LFKETEMDYQISDDAEHAKALSEIDKLWDMVPDTADGVESAEGQRLIALAEAVAAYEERRWPIDPDDFTGSARARSQTPPLP
jgi:antitoxin component HigA of HigAB toxin-antitoxin module